MLQHVFSDRAPRGLVSMAQSSGETATEILEEPDHWMLFLLQRSEIRGSAGVNGLFALFLLSPAHMYKHTHTHTPLERGMSPTVQL